MPNSPVRKKSKEVLRALHENGPMTIKTMSRLLNPTFSMRGAQRITKHLFDLGLVEHLHGGLAKNVGHYFQLSSNLYARKQIAEHLNVNIEDFRGLRIRTQELQHWQDCILWADRFKHLIPDSEIIKDFRIVREHAALKMLIVKPTDFEMLPDFIIKMPITGGYGFSHIAVEVERTIKSRKRLFRKLDKYASKSKLDGVLYICETDGIGELIFDVYNSRVFEKATRIGHYGSNFLVVTRNEIPNKSIIPKLHNSNGKNIFFENWIHFLRSNELTKRRDSELL